MELFASDTHFVLVDGNDSLWIDRHSGSYEAKSGSDTASDLGTHYVCLGTVYGYIGKLRISQSSETRLVFIRQHALIGMLKGCAVYKIVSVVSVPLESEAEIFLEPCCKSKEHHGTEQDHNGATTSPNHQAATAVPDPNNGHRPAFLKVRTPAIRSGPRKVEKQDKLERRMLDEFHKMFTEADSFYYSSEYDITNSLQRLQKPDDGHHDAKLKCMAIWERADLRFFWNWYMVESLVNTKNKKLNRWIQPIIQGFIQTETCQMDPLYDSTGVVDSQVRGVIDLWLISRRSRFQAGTRYLRRGVDEHGKVANYVETEQLMIFKSHMISFIQIRGSIPVFWSQPNRYRYRPPPILERDEEENYNAFQKHFEEETSIYGHVVAVNLVEKTGKEKVLGDAYLNNVIKHNAKDLSYVTFDFHESCRGMKFENVSRLISKLNHIIKTMNYCWVDSYGVVLKQSSIFRVNCVDCLDRTNVVQTHIAREMLTIQLSKLGLIVPEIGLPNTVRRITQSLWANNGDTISKQYAGTNALKGDFTRTGERRITGVMKDGMNSANRYYLNRFKDASRQAAIDLMLGVRKYVTEDDLAEEKQPDEKENPTEQIKLVIEDVKRCVVPPEEIILGSWGLVNAKLNEPDTIDIDAIFVITEKHYYVVEYDCTLDSMTDTQKVDLTSVQSLELGYDTLMQPTTFWNIFYPGNNSNQTLVPNLQINYSHEDELLSHEFRSSNIRFFNNVAIPIQQPEEMQEALRMLAEAIKIAVQAQGKEIQLLQSNPTVQKDTHKPRIPVIATTWVHRYFTSNQQDSGNGADNTIPFAKKLTTASIERFTPKYFRRGSNATVASTQRSVAASHVPEIISGSGNVLNKDGGDAVTSESKTTCQPGLDLATTQRVFPDLIDFNVRPPFEGHVSLFMPVNDLVLPSCGIISLPQRRRVVASPLVTPELILDEENRSGAGVSPITPVSDSNSQEVTTNQPISIHSKLFPYSSQSLQRHRYSLPANTLGITVDPSMPRPKTPEITITEEPQSQYAAAFANMTDNLQLVTQNVPGAQKISRRISRSSEDVNKVGGIISHDIPALGGIISSTHNATGFKIPSLFPLKKNDTRASSQQDISDSLVNMRGSHSDNALRENPFQNNQSTQKRDLVLAPLGKLARGMQNIGANYFDPRKLRDSFKPVAKRDVVEDTLLEERKKQCQTLIIDA